MTHSGRVLVVEDDRSLRRACEVSLRQRGFDVMTAVDGEEGLQLAGVDPLPNVILLDLLMPKLPGIEVLKALKENPLTAGIPVVILSNSSRDENKVRALAHRARGSSAVFGAVSLAALLLAFEDRAIATTADEDGHRMREVTREFAAVTPVLQSYLQELTSTP